MEVSWIPPVNGDSNFAAIIKLKGADRRQELSSQESESEDEEVGFGGQLEDNTTPPDGVGSNVQATVKQKEPEPKQELSSDESKSDDEEVGFGGQMKDNKTPPDGVGSNVQATMEQKTPAPKERLFSDESESENKEVGFGQLEDNTTPLDERLFSDESESENKEVGFGQLEDNTTPLDGVGANVQATMEQKAPEPKQELSADENNSQECNVTANTTTGNLKEMIQENTQMPVAQQRLTCNPKQLEENITPPDSVGSNVAATVKHKGPKPKPELFFDETQSQDEKAGSEKSYQIFVKRIDGKLDTYNVTTNLTVVELKQMVAERSDLKPAEQRLLYESKQLEDNMTLGHYGIKHTSTVHLTMRMKGG
ncbi:polyubiquitin [Plakobranchus ocellatus]|uniref:Polyubiquitin n=1 Tax=Plakobranchus ocellatus TaxID=259542 RepID=A0AAV4BP64_9GAST|nr:polyubiquitin [Plakobranchus ocellatus]